MVGKLPFLKQHIVLVNGEDGSKGILLPIKDGEIHVHLGIPEVHSLATGEIIAGFSIAEKVRRVDSDEMSHLIAKWENLHFPPKDGESEIKAFPQFGTFVKIVNEIDPVPLIAAMMNTGEFDRVDENRVINWGEMTAPESQRILDMINREFHTDFRFDDFAGR